MNILPNKEGRTEMLCLIAVLILCAVIVSALGFFMWSAVHSFMHGLEV